MTPPGEDIATDVELVEFHDAIVERIELTRRAEVCIEFSHLAVYRRETAETCGVWSFHAELRLVGVESVTVEGLVPRHDADSLQDLEIVAAEGAPFDPTVLLKSGSCALGSVELTWAVSGAKAIFRGGRRRSNASKRGRARSERAGLFFQGRAPS